MASELEHYIKSYFGVVEATELQQIVALFKPTTIQKGDYFLKSGHLSTKLSFVQSGLMRIYVSAPEKEITQWISSKGYFVVDLASFVFETPARWTIQALSDAELFTISREDYIHIEKWMPNWNRLEKLFLARCFTLLEDRIFSHLSMSAEERYEFFY